MNAIVAMVGKTLLNIGVKFLAEEFLEELFVWGAKELAKSTKTKADDELVAKIEEHLADSE